MTTTAGHGSVYPDHGCRVATVHLKAQSHCLACPFPECIENDGAPHRAERAMAPKVLPPPKKRGRRPTQEAKERISVIRELHAMGWQCKRIARHLSLSTTYVYEVWNG